MEEGIKIKENYLIKVNSIQSLSSSKEHTTLVYHGNYINRGETKDRKSVV